MATKSNIEWTDSSWNPIIGCTKVSMGCANCYAETLAERFRGVKNHPFENGFDLRLVPDKLNEPIAWRKPRRVFVCSMSDLFHEEIPDSYIAQIFNVMANADHHIFQVLTKRSERMLSFSKEHYWPNNVWAGVTVEHSMYLDRVKHLVASKVSTRFLSLEPLLGPLPKLNLRMINWVIVGGESGPRARPMDIAWARQIRDKCSTSQIPFFLKQLGGRSNKRGGDLAVLDGRRWHQYPTSLAIALPAT